jgi:hypothetical protein
MGGKGNGLLRYSIGINNKRDLLEVVYKRDGGESRQIGIMGI